MEKKKQRFLLKNFLFNMEVNLALNELNNVGACPRPFRDYRRLY